MHALVQSYNPKIKKSYNPTVKLLREGSMAACCTSSKNVPNSINQPICLLFLHPRGTYMKSLAKAIMSVPELDVLREALDEAHDEPQH